MAYRNWWKQWTNNFVYKDVTIDCDLLENVPVDGYLSETKYVEFNSDEMEFDSDCNELLDLGPMNSDENVYKEDWIMNTEHWNEKLPSRKFKF